jgi:cell pole-organizing protein PopZ
MSEDTALGIDSIDQILEKIKKAINSEPLDAKDSADILELTNVVSKAKDEESDLISQHVRNFTQKLNLLMQGNYVIAEKEIMEIFKETLRPYLKSWLNNNVKLIAKEVLECEMTKILEKLYEKDKDR